MYEVKYLIELSPSPSWREVKRNKKKYRKEAREWVERIIKRYKHEQYYWNWNIISVKYNGRKRISDKALEISIRFIEYEDVIRVKNIARRLIENVENDFAETVAEAIARLRRFLYA